MAADRHSPPTMVRRLHPGSGWGAGWVSGGVEVLRGAAGGPRAWAYKCSFYDNYSPKGSSAGPMDGLIYGAAVEGSPVTFIRGANVDLVARFPVFFVSLLVLSAEG